jgi:hypothetical protein
VEAEQARRRQEEFYETLTDNANVFAALVSGTTRGSRAYACGAVMCLLASPASPCGVGCVPFLALAWLIVSSPLHPPPAVACGHWVWMVHRCGPPACHRHRSLPCVDCLGDTGIHSLRSLHACASVCAWCVRMRRGACYVAGSAAVMFNPCLSYSARRRRLPKSRQPPPLQTLLHARTVLPRWVCLCCHPLWRCGVRG